jgi:hypothetical protein
MFNFFSYDANKIQAMSESVQIFSNRRICLKNLFLNESFLVEVSLIPKSRIESIMACMYKYAPELQLIDIDIIRIGKIMTPEKNELQVLQEANYAFEFFEVKRDKCFASFIALQENPDFHNEISLIAEKYDKVHDSQAYLSACTEIFRRYIGCKIA